MAVRLGLFSGRFLLPALIFSAFFAHHTFCLPSASVCNPGVWWPYTGVAYSWASLGTAQRSEVHTQFIRAPVGTDSVLLSTKYW